MRILFIDIDTLRPDHLGCYGYHRATSPAIDQLADVGVRFANAYASDVPCLPSRTALATGMFGIRNGVVNHGGQAADLRPWGSGRSFTSQLAWRSFAGVLLSAGYHTASFSSFPLRHGATWWTAGFLESMNPVRGMGLERADEVVPGVVDWLDRRGRSDKWFLHVHLWDPHTPYNAPAVFGNPFAEAPLPEWHTEEVRARNWSLAGPHSAQEPSGFSAAGSSGRSPFHIPSLASMEEVRGVFDGYDRGVRSADDAVATLCSKLADLGVLDDTAVWVGSDHGEAFGELGVYADHQAADEATTHVPALLVWPGLEPSVQEGLHYHLDVAATVADLAGVTLPDHWDGVSVRTALESGEQSEGRDALVLSQGAWSCQRAVRFDRWLYLLTLHDGYHPHWPTEMLFDLRTDPHEQFDLAASRADELDRARATLADWRAEQLARSLSPTDPLDTVLAEGGPMHVRGHLDRYLERLEETGRSQWIEPLKNRHRTEFASGVETVPWF